jgi:GTP-binding protein Era
MNRTAGSALAEADLCVLVVAALEWTHGDALVLERIASSGLPAIAAVNKIDRAQPRERLLPFIADLARHFEFREIVPVSALKLEQVDVLREAIAKHLPVAPALFAPGTLTDRDLSFRIAELIRERLTLELNQEVPYGIAVEVERMAEVEGQLVVDAAIWVDRAGQKPIVIGAGGERLKRVGRAARLQLNELLKRRVHLELWVKVREDWADDARALQHLGLE